MKYFFLILFFFFGLSLNIFAQTVEINGFSTQYSNDTLTFYTFDDLITNNEKELIKTLVNDSGYFSCSFDLKETSLAYIYLGIYKGLIYFEPGKYYEIKLPDRKDKNIGDSLNPYFNETELYLGIYNSNKDELNFLIKKFDYFYDNYIQDKFYILYQQGYNSKVDTFITKLSNYFSFANNTYFSYYMKYKFAYLRYIAYERDLKFVTKEYYLNQAYLYNNTAYMTMFNLLYQNYFTYYSQTQDGENIFSDIARAKSIYHLKKTLDNNISLSNDTLKELVILKGLLDAFSPKNVGEYKSFPGPQLLQTLDSMIVLTKIPEHKHIAENIKKKVTKKRLIQGEKAPEFELLNKDNEFVSLKSFSGKYLYLTFYSTWSYSCLKEIGLLKNIYDKHKKDIEIVTIFCDGTMQNMIDIIEKNDYSWTFLHINDKTEILKIYNIIVYPSYFLIDPYGEIILVPAPSPNEDFERNFFKILNSRG